MTTKQQRELIDKERAETKRMLAAYRRSMARYARRHGTDWSDPVNARYDVLRGRGTNVDRQNRRQMAALREQLRTWNPRRLHTAVNGQIVDPADYARMQRAARKARAAERRMMQQVGALRTRHGETIGDQYRRGGLRAALGAPPHPKASQATSAAAYGQLVRRAEQGQNQAVEKARQAILKMLDSVPGTGDMQRRVQRLSGAGVLSLRLDSYAMSAIKDMYMSGDSGDLQGSTEVGRYLDRAEAMK